MYKLVKRSFYSLKFESSPFLQHLAILKSIIQKNRIIYENLDLFELEYEKEKAEDSEYVPIEPKVIVKEPVPEVVDEPKHVYVEPKCRIKPPKV